MEWYIIFGIIVFLAIAAAAAYYFLYNKKITHVYDDYTVIEIPNLLTNEECDKLIELATKEGLHESEVLNYTMDKTTTTDEKFRKCEQAWLNNDVDPLVQKISKMTETLTGYAMETQEMLQVARYKPGGLFTTHYDACDSDDKKYCDTVNNNAGQRTATLIIYLNDDFEEGETEFVNLKLTIKPVKGKGLLFKNVDKDDVIYEKSLHKGNEVKKGTKWICTKWSHSRKY